MEDTIFMLIGIAMFYAWIHGAIIVGKKVENTTTYENVVLIAGLVALVLLVLGLM